MGSRRLTFAPVPGKGPKKIVYSWMAKWPRPGGEGKILLVSVCKITIGGVDRFDVWFDKEHHTSPSLDTFEKGLDKAEELLDAMDPRRGKQENVHEPDEGDDAVDLPPVEAYSDIEGGLQEGEG